MRACFLMVFFFAIWMEMQAQQWLIPFRKDSLWGYADSTGKILVKPQYYRTYFFNGAKYKILYQKINNNLLMGLIKKNGQELIAPAYKILSTVEAFSFQKNYNLRIFEDVAYNEYARRTRYENQLIENYYIGSLSKEQEHLIDSTGKVVLDSVTDISVFNKYGEGFFTVSFKKNNQYGVANRDGKILMEPKYESLVYLFGNSDADFIIATKGSQKALIQMNGKIIIPFAEQGIQVKDELFRQQPLFLVNRGKLNAIYNHTGKKLAGFTDKFIRVEIVKNKEKEQLAYFYSDKEEVVKGEVTQAAEDRVADNRPANMAYPPAEDNSNYTNNNFRIIDNQKLVIFKKDNLFGLQNKEDSSIIISAKYTQLSWCFDANTYIKNWIGLELLFANQQKKSGILDVQGKIIIPFKYETLSPIRLYSSNLNKIIYFFATKKDGSKGVLNHLNQTVIPFQYKMISNENYLLLDTAFNFYVQNKEDNFGILSNKNMVQIPVENQVLFPLYLELPNATTRYFMAKPVDKLYGIKDLGNKEILPPVYDSIKEPFYLWDKRKVNRDKIFANYCFPVKYQGKYGIAKTDGTYLLEPKYDDIFQVLNPYEKEPEYYFTTIKREEKNKASFALYSSKKGLLQDYSQRVEYRTSELNDFENGMIMIKDPGTFLNGIYFSNINLLVPPIYTHIFLSYEMNSKENKNNKSTLYYTLVKRNKNGEEWEDLISNKGVKFFEDTKAAQ